MGGDIELDERYVHRYKLHTIKWVHFLFPACTIRTTRLSVQNFMDLAFRAERYVFETSTKPLSSSPIASPEAAQRDAHRRLQVIHADHVGLVQTVLFFPVSRADKDLPR